MTYHEEACQRAINVFVMMGNILILYHFTIAVKSLLARHHRGHHFPSAAACQLKVETAQSHTASGKTSRSAYPATAARA